MTAALLAALCVLAADVVWAVAVTAAARGRGWLAGLANAAWWLVVAVAASVTVNALAGAGSAAHRVVVVVAVVVANVTGTRLGVAAAGWLFAGPRPMAGPPPPPTRTSRDDELVRAVRAEIRGRRGRG